MLVDPVPNDAHPREAGIILYDPSGHRRPRGEGREGPCEVDPVDLCEEEECPHHFDRRQLFQIQVEPDVRPRVCLARGVQGVAERSHQRAHPLVSGGM